MARTYILNKQQIQFKLKRMALQIAERNFDATQLVLAGIAPQGPIIIEQLITHLQPYFKGTLQQLTLHLDKRHPTTVTLEGTATLNANTVLLLVDDVANSGKTLTYALKPFLEQHPASIQTLVLVNRTHKKYPVQPDYVGFTLATTLQEYIDVEVQEGELVGAWVE
ncbi:MAG TPA: phosphoribosyltransferase family protein [Phnomibacter sp.]|nr:phosphoribosyltransferase family protein [Phnomibacter sp.]